MGRESRCVAEFDGFRIEGRLLLETDELVFRAARRFAVPRASIRSAVVRDGWLEIVHAAGNARFEVGKGAERWAHDILHPKSRIDKLDVKPTARAVVLGLDAEFAAEVRARAAHVDARLGKGPYDLVFLQADSPRDLERLAGLRARLQPAGTIWVITPKGDAAMKHEVIVDAARRAGLIDTKTARFSETHTSLKLVIPRADRR